LTRQAMRLSSQGAGAVERTEPSTGEATRAEATPSSFLRAGSKQKKRFVRFWMQVSDLSVSTFLCGLRPKTAHLQMMCSRALNSVGSSAPSWERLRAWYCSQFQDLGPCLEREYSLPHLLAQSSGAVSAASRGRWGVLACRRPMRCLQNIICVKAKRSLSWKMTAKT